MPQKLALIALLTSTVIVAITLGLFGDTFTNEPHSRNEVLKSNNAAALDLVEVAPRRARTEKRVTAATYAKATNSKATNALPVVVCSLERDVPIEGASIELFGRERSQLLGETDSMGSAQIDICGVQPGDILVIRRSGYAARRLDLRVDTDSELRVHLAPEAVIAGRILLPEPLPAGHELRVYAIRNARFQMPDYKQGDLKLLTSTQSVNVGRDGYFCIGELDAGTPYSLDIIGRGYTLRGGDPARRVTAPRKDVELLAHVLYGSVMRFTCDDQEYLDAVFDTIGYRITRTHGGVNVDGALGQKLRGVNLVGFDKRDHDLFVAFGYHGLDVQRPSVNFTMDPIGFEPIDTTVELEPAAAGGFPIKTVELSPLASVYGALTISISGESDNCVLQRALAFSINVRSISVPKDPSTSRTSGGCLAFRWEAGSRSSSAENLPPGIYAWETSLGGQLDRIGNFAGNFTIDADMETVIDIEFPDHAYLRLEAVDDLGHSVVAKFEIASRVEDVSIMFRWKQRVSVEGGSRVVGNRSRGRGPVSGGLRRWSLAWWNDLNPTRRARAARC